MRRAEWKLNVKRIQRRFRNEYKDTEMRKPQGHHRFYEILAHISQYQAGEYYYVKGFENVNDSVILLAEEIAHGSDPIENFRLPRRWRKQP